MYMIGVGLESAMKKSVIVQVNRMDARERRFLNLTALQTALETDPDLGSVCSEEFSAERFLQTINVCTGCDYTSFFSGMCRQGHLLQVLCTTCMLYYWWFAPRLTGKHQPGQ